MTYKGAGQPNSPVGRGGPERKKTASAEKGGALRSYARLQSVGTGTARGASRERAPLVGV